MSLVTGVKISGVMSGATLGAAYLADGNRFLRMMQSLIQANVINQTTTTPPATPNSGDTYIVGTAATGAWSGKATQIAYWASADQSFTTAAWDFYVPVEGWLVYDQTQNYFYWFDGSAWQRFSFGGAGTSFTSSPSWWMSGDGTNYSADGGATGLWSTGTANEVKFWMTRIPFTITVSTVTYRHNTSLASSRSSLGLYSGDGATKIFSCDNFDTNVSAGAKTLTPPGGPFTITPGVYIFACGTDHTGSSPGTQGGYKTAGSSDNTNAYNISTARSGTAGNPLGVSAAMPSSLGSLATSVTLGLDIPSFCLNP